MSVEKRIKLIRITTVPVSLHLLLTGQMGYMKGAGMDVVMISAKGDVVENIVESEDVRHEVVPFTRSISPLRDLYCLVKLVYFFWKINPDIVHTHTPKAGLLGMIAAHITNVPLRVHTIAGLPLMTAKGWKRKMFSLTERLTYWSANQVLPNSRSMYSYMIDSNLCDPCKMRIIAKGSTNGIDINRYSIDSILPSKLEKIKGEIGYVKDAIYLLAVGRMVRDKGITELVESFLILRKYKQNKLKLLLLGPMENVRTEESLSCEILNIIETDKDIVHISWSDDVEYFMYLADVLVHASHREGFPNVLLQAGAMGCPIICSNIPGNIDVVSHQETGLLYNKGETNDLKEKLIMALNSPKLMENYSYLLREKVVTNFERTYVHNEYYHFYKNAIVSCV